MNVIDIITKKRDGLEMNQTEIEFMVQGITDGSIPDYQISAWAMAVYFQGMSDAETAALTMAMANSGEVMDLSTIDGVKVDKHSTGGVGDKATLAVIPLAAAAGVPVVKMSGRSLGHTGGTVDKFESIPGFKVELNRQELLDQVQRVGAVVVSQSGDLAPADKKLYAIRDVTATVESIPLIASSIMSKKIAAGAQGIVLDVKAGRGAFMKEQKDAFHLAEVMVRIGRHSGQQVVALITDMSQPLGYNIGNALEVREVIDLLKGSGPEDLRELCFELAARMVVLGGKANSIEIAREQVKRLLASGAALAKFDAMVTAQGGHLHYEQPGYGLPQAGVKEEVYATESGYVAAVDAMKVGHGAMLLGAGRQQLGDKIDPAAGIELIKKRGDYVQTGETIAVMHSNREKSIQPVRELLLEAFRIDQAAVANTPLVLGSVG
ncbi:MAG TPA: pyrimidine-nucleoside phosphorylase [Syntrophomonas sp.]|nr:pyrimidine-nucleoside phosphorylase [Syntrophomonas sp.]